MPLFLQEDSIHFNCRLRLEKPTNNLRKLKVKKNEKIGIDLEKLLTSTSAIQIISLTAFLESERQNANILNIHVTQNSVPFARSNRYHAAAAAAGTARHNDASRSFSK